MRHSATSILLGVLSYGGPEEKFNSEYVTMASFFGKQIGKYDVLKDFSLSKSSKTPICNDITEARRNLSGAEFILLSPTNHEEYHLTSKGMRHYNQFIKPSFSQGELEEIAEIAECLWDKNSTTKSTDVGSDSVSETKKAVYFHEFDGFSGKF
jgi:hypothetical protein